MFYSTEKSINLIQKSVGLRFHHAFPGLINYECNPECGGCGVYPNIHEGRKGVQLVATENSWVCLAHNLSHDGD